MKNALILHGTDGSPDGNWFGWLERNLQVKGYKVWVPALPQSEKPNIDRYNKFIFSQWKFDGESIIVGHSSGAVAILGILQALPPDVVINKAILVAGFIDDLDWEPLKELFLVPLDWEKIKKLSKQFILFHSDDDPYVPLAHGKELEKLLAGKLIILRGQGHFNLEKGPEYKQFPALLDKILE